ncbi:hypothetical protein SNE40_004642 [Patella caerulea]|uniref:PLAT domain-containing protein n=1 Tax=Patella caerulea TaxID=87958 RepID=A0AAN8K9Z1_PATCE
MLLLTYLQIFVLTGFVCGVLSADSVEVLNNIYNEDSTETLDTDTDKTMTVKASPHPTTAKVTPRPTTVTSKPTTVTPQPATVIVTPKKTTVRMTPNPTTIKPTTVTPKPTTVTPKPTTVTPKPTTLTPKPTTVKVTPSPTTLTPTTVTPKPTTVTPKSTTLTPKPTTLTPKPTTVKVTSKPTTVKMTPEPTTVKVTPRPTTTKPTTVTPKPTTVTPKPTTVTPKPTTAQVTPQPTTVKVTPKATTVKPTTATPTPSTPDPRANKTVCYKDLGCFDNFYPFNNAILDLPESPDVIGISVTLYTRQNREHDKGQLILFNNTDTIQNSDFDAKRPTKIIIHGFSNDLNTDWLHKMKDEFLINDDFNVLIVGWGNGAKFPDYAQAVANTRVVSAFVYKTILGLSDFGAKMEDLHLIGHSLGAHTSGFVGHLLGGTLQRITGLDPADPDYEQSPPLVVLDPTDAKYVDIIHSNGAPLSEGGAGLYNQSGHIDFYLNGGKHQPGCDDGLAAIGDILHGQGITQSLACSHGRSHDAFIESINARCPFTAYPCSDYDAFEAGKCLDCGSTGCSVLGYYSDQYYARGKMYLDTTSKSPLCGYHYGVTIKGADLTPDTKGKISLRLKGKWGDSGFVAATKNDQALKKGQTFSHVMVSPQEVGDVEFVTIKYEKYSGFWFGGGKDKYSVESVEVKSGENGYTYKFCLMDKELNHGTEVQTVKSSPKYHC